jgi:hypothetical protein
LDQIHEIRRRELENGFCVFDRPARTTIAGQSQLRMKFRLTHKPQDFFRGTLAPFLRASERPIAIACLRLFTLLPLPPFPDRSVPLFLRRIALATVFPAALPYLRRLDFFFVGMRFLSK